LVLSAGTALNCLWEIPKIYHKGVQSAAIFTAEENE